MKPYHVINRFFSGPAFPMNTRIDNQSKKNNSSTLKDFSRCLTGTITWVDSRDSLDGCTKTYGSLSLPLIVRCTVPNLPCKQWTESSGERTANASRTEPHLTRRRDFVETGSISSMITWKWCPGTASWYAKEPILNFVTSLTLRRLAKNVPGVLPSSAAGK